MTSGATDKTAIVYPESDCMPLFDGHFQDPQFREIVSTLATHFRDRPNMTMSVNTFIYYQ